MTEQRTREETETPSEDDDEEVEEVTHTTRQGREVAPAYASVKEDWAEHHDDRPDDVRREGWINPFFEPLNPTETEKRLVKTRRIRQRVLGWTGDLP